MDIGVDIQFYYGKDAGWIGYHVGHTVNIIDEYGRVVVSDK